MRYGIAQKVGSTVPGAEADECAHPGCCVDTALHERGVDILNMPVQDLAVLNETLELALNYRAQGNKKGHVMAPSEEQPLLDAITFYNNMRMAIPGRNERKRFWNTPEQEREKVNFTDISRSAISKVEDPYSAHPIITMPERDVTGTVTEKRFKVIFSSIDEKNLPRGIDGKKGEKIVVCTEIDVHGNTVDNTLRVVCFGADLPLKNGDARTIIDTGLTGGPNMANKATMEQVTHWVRQGVFNGKTVDIIAHSQGCSNAIALKAQLLLSAPFTHTTVHTTTLIDPFGAASIVRSLAQELPNIAKKEGLSHVPQDKIKAAEWLLENTTSIVAYPLTPATSISMLNPRTPLSWQPVGDVKAMVVTNLHELQKLKESGVYERTAIAQQNQYIKIDHAPLLHKPWRTMVHYFFKQHLMPDFFLNATSGEYPPIFVHTPNDERFLPNLIKNRGNTQLEKIERFTDTMVTGLSRKWEKLAASTVHAAQHHSITPLTPKPLKIENIVSLDEIRRCNIQFSVPGALSTPPRNKAANEHEK